MYGQANHVQAVNNIYPTAAQILPNKYNLMQSYGGMTKDHSRLGSMYDDTRLISDGMPSANLTPNLTLLNRPDLNSGSYSSTRSPGVPASPSSSVKDYYTSSTPGVNRHQISPRSGYDQLPRNSYNYPETPRSLMSTSSLVPSPTYGHPVGLTVDRRGAESPPFHEQDNFHGLYSDGQQIMPFLETKIEKGFFWSTGQNWTCYRRNYLSVQCSFNLKPYPVGRQLFLIKDGKKAQHPIQAMAVSLSAAIDGGEGKRIELVQHTPKRDRGPQAPVGIIKLSPTPPMSTQTHLHSSLSQSYHIDQFGQPSLSDTMEPLYLPLQADMSPPPPLQDEKGEYLGNVTSPTSHQHTFERIQFKSATANNGKRRAQQQYYHLIVELHVDIRELEDKLPKWIKVAQRVSYAVVVRGRSPSHYSNEGPHSARSSGGASGAGGSGSVLNLGGMLRSGPTTSFGSGLPYGSGMGHQAYRGNTYALDPSPIGNYSSTSAASIVGATTHSVPEVKPGILASNTEDGNFKIPHNPDGYQYFGTHLQHATLQPPVKPEGLGHGFNLTGRVKDELSQAFPPGGIHTAWGLGRCAQLEGVSSSRSFYTAEGGY